jgi:hypothetical protein
MSSPNIKIHSGSRKPFAEEAPVVDAACQAAADIAHKYGKAQGSALFKHTARVSAGQTVHPQAVDIVRAAISRLAGAQGVAPPAGHVQAAAQIANEAAAAAKRRLDMSNAGQGVLESLRRLGIDV